MATELVSKVFVAGEWVGEFRRAYVEGFDASPDTHYFCVVHGLYLRKWSWCGCMYGVPEELCLE